MARVRGRWLLYVPLAAALFARLPLPHSAALWHMWQNMWGYAAGPLALITALLAHYPRDWRQLTSYDPRWLLGLELILFGGLALTAYKSGLSSKNGGNVAGWIGWSVAYEMHRFLGPHLTSAGLIFLIALGGYLSATFGPWAVDREVVRGWMLWFQTRLAPWLGWHLPSPKDGNTPIPPWRTWLNLPWPRMSKPMDASAATDFHIDVRSALPPLSLLERDAPGEGEYSRDMRRRAELIRNTLASFGVPVRVVEIHTGPAVTQFCVQPLTISKGGRTRRVSVREIVKHEGDLALALATSAIRIEAPVPGKPYVGIEVPNPEVDIVRLGGLLASEAFQRVRGPLAIALGREVTGRPVVADLTKLPHLLIAGATGSGKSVAISSMLVTWLMRNTPHDLRLLLVDPKRVELTNFNGIPHLLGSVVTDLEDALRALTWVTLQMDDRYRLFRRAKVRNIEMYNRWAKEHKKPALSYIAVVIDELADLMLATKGEAEHMLTRLAQMSRATGIHLVVATQRPSVDVITGLIKANFPARLAFAVASQVDSRVILDAPGAETLLGQGDALFQPPDRPSPIRLQGAYVSDEEIERVVTWWREREEGLSEQDVPWRHIELEEEKPPLEQALELVRKKERVSASLLQRQLHISFKKAQKLLEELETLGVVGPDEGNGRQVLR